MAEPTAKRERIKLPFWQQAQPDPSIKTEEGQLVKYARVKDRWWDKVQQWISWPLTAFDVETAPLIIVDLLAWQRDIDRFFNEPELLYRRRVKFAKMNADDAGSTAGFKRIWERMELGFIEVEERIDGIDWDIIRLNMTESLISEQPELLNFIIRKYGRTCRQYQFKTISNLVLEIRLINFNYNSECMIAV